MRRPVARHRLFAIVLVLLLAAASAAAQPRDIEGWRAARWGMTESELEGAFGAALVRLPGRWVYGGAYATRMIEQVPIGGRRFRAIFQMQAETDRLQQVLLERVRLPGQEAAFESTLAEFRRTYGVPTGVCGIPRAGGGPLSLEFWWRFPTSTVHLTFLDFFTRGMFSTDPNVDPDPLAPWFERRRNNPRFLPRRALVRFHPTDRTDLLTPPCHAEKK
jgi:hypothetical protein